MEGLTTGEASRPISNSAPGAPRRAGAARPRATGRTSRLPLLGDTPKGTKIGFPMDARRLFQQGKER